MFHGRNRDGNKAILSKSMHQGISYKVLVSVIDGQLDTAVKYLGVCTIVCLRLLASFYRRPPRPIYHLSPTNRSQLCGNHPNGMGGTRQTRQRMSEHQPISLSFMYDPALGRARRASGSAPRSLPLIVLAWSGAGAGFETRSAPKVCPWSRGPFMGSLQGISFFFTKRDASSGEKSTCLQANAAFGYFEPVNKRGSERKV